MCIWGATDASGLLDRLSYLQPEPEESGRAWTLVVLVVPDQRPVLAQGAPRARVYSTLNVGTYAPCIKGPNPYPNFRQYERHGPCRYRCCCWSTEPLTPHTARGLGISLATIISMRPLISCEASESFKAREKPVRAAGSPQGWSAQACTPKA